MIIITKETEEHGNEVAQDFLAMVDLYVGAAVGDGSTTDGKASRGSVRW